MKFLKIIMLVIGMWCMLLIGGVFLVSHLFSADEAESSVIYESGVEEFIDTIGETARDLGKEHDLYASVMIAQAMLESNKGKSSLAEAPNHNLFGIKGSYQNESVTFETVEDDGQGNITKVMAEFRRYPSYEASLKDYADLLRGGLSWDKHFYEATFKSNTDSYRDVTEFLTGTYATDAHYDKKLNSLIQQYNLERYDQ